jgi:hypothetical protein
VTPAELLRLNTSIAAKGAGGAESRGRARRRHQPASRTGGGRVTTWWDIALRAVEGALLPGHPAAVDQLTDGALSTATIAYTPEGLITGDAAFSLFRTSFPYLQTPLSGSPGPIHPDQAGRQVSR